MCSAIPETNALTFVAELKALVTLNQTLVATV